MYKNPLTNQERTMLMQHLSHDIRGSLNNLFYIFSELRKDPLEQDRTWGNSNVSHIRNSIASIEQLTSEEVSLEMVTVADIESRLIENKNAIKRTNGNMTIEVSRITPFETGLDVLGLAMYTLMGNSAVQVPHGKGEILVQTTDYDGEIEDIVYQNPITPTNGRFKRFRIQDTGPGFAFGQKFDLSIDTNPNNDDRDHFGLKLVGIISKYLMGHFSIKPKTNAFERGADLSFYHPSDIRSMYHLARFTADAKYAKI